MDKVDVLAVEGPYRVREEFVRGRNLPFFILVGRGNLALRHKSGRRVIFNSEAAANAALARVKAD